MGKTPCSRDTSMCATWISSISLRTVPEPLIAMSLLLSVVGHVRKKSASALKEGRYQKNQQLIKAVKNWLYVILRGCALSNEIS